MARKRKKLSKRKMNAIQKKMLPAMKKAEKKRQISMSKSYRGY